MTDTIAATQPLYLEDMTVGRRFTSGEHAMDAEQIVSFARQFDPQPFHLDDAAAKGTLFGGLAASGWHTAAITMRLQVTTGLPVAGGIIGASGDVAWPRPTRPTDVLHVVSEVMETNPSRSKPDRGMVTVRSETLNQHGDVLQVSTVRIVVPRKSGAAP
ncbi:MaoC family dehydratase [Acidovorax sp. LjRoot66]|uniref:MaoC family dehydratase n=1 Tax=Acidovorax sp. LjRoot66 TaxID=3342334 RepID=UPI003ECD7064